MLQALTYPCIISDRLIEINFSQHFFVHSISENQAVKYSRHDEINFDNDFFGEFCVELFGDADIEGAGESRGMC